jgi:hypothetical protein
MGTYAYNLSQSSRYDIWLLFEHGAQLWNLRS